MEKEVDSNEDANIPPRQEFPEPDKTGETETTGMVAEEVDNPRLRSSSVPVERIKQDNSEDILLEDSFECPESESARSKLISEALQQEDEFLEYLMSLPAASSGAKEKQQKPQQKHQTPAQPLLSRSMSSYGGNVSSGGGAKVGLDHLDNLCKLMEQLGDLREQNSKLQRRVQYLEDLKNLQEMHKQLQEETKRREFQEAAFLHTLQQHRQLSAKRHQYRRIVEENFPTPSLITRREGSEDSLTNEQMTSANNKRNSKCKSMANGKFRQSLLRYQQRERSRSVGIEEIKSDKTPEERSGHGSGETTKHRTQQAKQQRRSVVCVTGGTKAKVSKWTKVKEAFRWEKASVVMLPEAKSQDSGIGGISGGGGDDARFLRVPSGDSKSGDNLLSVSPVDSVLSGHSSSACSSGGQSPGYMTCQHPLADFNLPPATALSSSSSSEDLDIDLNFTDILADYGPQRSASATDSTGGRLLVQDTRRRSLSQMPEEEDASRRSKSLDGDATIGNSALIARHFATKDGVASSGMGKLPHQKSHKTPWGKVKDIIQTRKDSLKKRHRHGKTDTGNKSTSETAPSDHEEDTPTIEQARDSPEKDAESTGTKTSSTKPRIEVTGDGSTKRQHGKISTSSLDGYLQASDSPTNRRLTPVLTITLPSTEELRNVPPPEQSIVRNNSKPPPSPQTEDRHHKISTSSAPATSASFKIHHGANGNGEQVPSDDSNKCELYKRQVSLPRPASASAGTSPPVHRRASKWTKVKKAFLTSSTPGRRDDDGTGRISSSVPSSPNRNSSFFDEMDTDELSSGEYGDVVLTRTRTDEGDTEGAVIQKDSAQSQSIHAEIQKNYEELQQKLSQEFHKKLHEWERMKASSSTSSPGSRGPGGDDGYLHHDKGFRRKMEEWERMKHPQQNQSASTKHRDSVAFQTLDEDNLSPDFRKKLQEWQRIKKSLPVGTTPQSTGETYVSGGAVPPQFKKRIAEWQLWRSGSGKSDGQHRGEDQTEDYHRKQQEWERTKAASSSPSPETVTTQSAAGQENSEGASGTKTPSPGIVRKNSTGNSKGVNKKIGSSSKSSAGVNATESPGSGKEKYEVGGAVSTKTGVAGGKIHQKGKSQKEKELQWLEKELHKIEREKQRLEREREKYLEREARLEKMRRAMGSGQRKQEVLIQTSTGFFRFQGISEKFTRRLYEWEKARGIGPEASTFALLDPGYRPPGNGSSSGHGGCSDNVEGNLLSRSKSASSVTNLGTGVTNVGTSSLSLNDVEVLEQAEAATLEDSRAASEPHLRTSDGPEEAPEDDEPAAVIVDVEDVIEETAAPLPVTPVVQSQTPVYCYAPEEVTRLIDSSGSDSERDSSKLVQRNDSVRTESSYKLLEENMSLLNKLKLKEDICRKLENEIENLEGKIDDVAKTRKQELQRLRQEETDLQVQSEGEQVTSEEPVGPQEELVAALRARIRELEQRQEWLLREGETLQDSFAQHSEQQAALAQNLVGKMKQLQEANINMATCDQSEPLRQDSNSHLDQQVDAISIVQDLSTQLLNLAEKLEVALAERSREVHNLRYELQDRRHKQHKLKSGQHWYFEEGMSVSMGSLAELEDGTEAGTYAILPRQSSEELSQLPSLLTNKVLELKEGLNFLCAASGVSDTEQQKSKDPAPEKDRGDSDTTATFVFKFGKKIDASADAEHDDVPTVVQVDSEGNTSPVTCVTITPAFWKKRDKSVEEQTAEASKQEVIDTKVTEDVTAREEQSSPANRDSFCSAVSSASANSSVCDEDEDVEKDADSYVSEAEVRDCRTTSAAAASDESANRKEDISEGSMNDSDHDKSSDDEDDDDEDDDDEDEDAKTTIKCERDGEPAHENEIHGGYDNNQDYNYKSLFGEPYPGYYETEVYTCKGNGAARQRKVLKTRRVSDTHIGYKRDEVDRKEDATKLESGNSDNDSENGKSAAADNSYRATSRKAAAHTKETYCRKERNKNQRRKGDEKERNNDAGIVDAILSENSDSGFGHDRPPMRDGRSSPDEERASDRTLYRTQDLSESCSTPTPDNVFVKTTRKIFSPVRRDSKGKTSSVVGYVVGETVSSSGTDAATQLPQETDQPRPAVSPAINVLRREQGGMTSVESSPSIHNKGRNLNNGMSPPSWMYTRNRSQSSSPALARRKAATTADKSSSETISSSDPNSLSSTQKMSPERTSRAELSETKAPTSEGKLPTDSRKELPSRSGTAQENPANAEAERIEASKPEEQSDAKRGADVQRESSAEKNKIERSENTVPPSRPVTPSSNFPPLPQSPNPGRRDLFKIATKETAPSIRMMIAKYNQKLTEQQEGAGGRSPEIGGSGSASPVAWRSPVAERRVRAQMERYQEEVQRVLRQGAKKASTRFGGSRVQKSASDGVIRAPESPSVLTPVGESANGTGDSVTSSKPLSSFSQPRSILKSTSAGSIKPASSAPLAPVASITGPTASTKPLSEPVKSTPLGISPPPAATTKPPSPRVNLSPGPSGPSSPELGLHHHSSPPPSRLRALRLQRAKEEFLTRGPGGRSWTSDGGTPSTDTPSASVSPEPFWGPETSAQNERDVIRPGVRIRDTGSGNRSRLSQISVESESSYDGSVALPGGTKKNVGDVGDEGTLLVKSASAGMINVDPNTYRKFYEERRPVDQQPGSTSDGQEGKPKTQACSKFGISSIASRFRKVKMRKTKDREGGKMNTVSTLCRQSLLVDLHLSKGGAASGAVEVPGPSTSKSCPSSPVLQRSSSGEKPGSGASSAPTSWILNPARKIFKPK